jgi:hypothetical protein
MTVDIRSDVIARLGGIGVLIPEDIPPINEAVARVLSMMRDGEWHSATEIIAQSGQREGLRRMRELRRWFQINRVRIDTSRDFWYRLTPPPPLQNRLPGLG